MQSTRTLVPFMLSLLSLATAACSSVTIETPGGTGGASSSASTSTSSSSSSSSSATGGAGGSGAFEPKCPPTLNGEAVVGCGFPPTFSLIGVDAEAVYALTQAGALYRVELVTGHRTRLFAPDAPVVPPASARLHGGALYFAANLTHAGTKDLDLFTIAADHGTTQPTALLSMPSDVAAPDLQVDDGFVYYASASGSALRRAPLAGGQPADLFAQPTMPVALQGGSVYHLAAADHTVRRTPVDGTASTVIASGSELAGRDYDADSGFFYWADRTAQEAIRRCPLAGGNADTLTTFYPGDGDTPGPGSLFGLRADADSVYFLTRDGSPHPLFRIPRTALMLDKSAFDALGDATSLPVFDASSMFIARATDPADGPAEGMIVRVAK